MQLIQPLSLRILSRIRAARKLEPDAWVRDDLDIAYLTVMHAARGDAVECSPHVLATYEVLGTHPEKVWPKIEARRHALFGAEGLAVPKKLPQSVKLWCEKTNAVRAANSHGAVYTVLREPSTKEPMASVSIAALYPKPDAQSSAKTRPFTYAEMLSIVQFSGAPVPVRNLTLAALAARGPWPKEDGPATPALCISIIGMQIEAGVHRSTIQRRIKRARQLGFWQKKREANCWLPCPKCGAEREESMCAKCKHKGSGKDLREFRRPYTYEIDVQKFLTAPRCREIRSVDWRTYSEYKEAIRRGEPTNVTPIRKNPAPAPQPDPPPAHAAPRPERERERPAAEHRTVTTQVSARLTSAAKLVMEMCGLPEIGGAVPYVEAAVLAEAKFRGVEIEDAAKHIAECALRDQRNGIALTRFYFRDGKWRTNGGPKAGAAGRAERSKQQIAEALRRFNRNAEVDLGADPFDGTELKE